MLRDLWPSLLDSHTIDAWTNTRRQNPRGRPRVLAQGVVEGTSDPSHHTSRAALPMTPPRRLLFARPNNSRRTRKAAADRQAADQSTMAVADDPTAMATTRVTSSSPSASSLWAPAC
jgi:hypothetical protein